MSRVPFKKLLLKQMTYPRPKTMPGMAREAMAVKWSTLETRAFLVRAVV